MWVPPSSPHSINSADSREVASASTIDLSRTERLAKLRESIQNGTYKVNLSAVAKSMVERGLFDVHD
ncbi:flagellar biosynthesis anti-sigma factor FlgM [Alicyclobacillus sendaiensis]|uniref:flagellar biosynthesis anti-sigma factor FlgM n=1 Tax=Alicyclobacillus sendaiensis TaxID=192387 RepID=UPI0034CE28C3